MVVMLRVHEAATFPVHLKELGGLFPGNRTIDEIRLPVVTLACT